MKTARRSLLARLVQSEKGVMALTTSQMFLGALTIGFGVFRGTSAYEGLHYETQLGHANYGASKLAGDHARSANVNANNNVVSTALMGPRFSVEADNITMLADAAIACPQVHNPPMVALCAEFHANYPRMLRKLVWVRLKQAAVWGSLGKLSAAIDKAASLTGLDQIRSATSAIDAAVKIRVEDPTLSGNTWSGDSTKFACDYATIDALASVMPESAFPILMHMNLLQGLPRALVAIMPQILCGGGGTGGPTAPFKNAIEETTAKLDMVPSVAKAASDACNAIQSAIESGLPNAAAAASGDIAKYMKCDGGQPCVIDRPKCDDDKLQEASAAFLESVGLPKISSIAASLLGGSTRAPVDADWNWSDQMRACTFASKPIDESIVRINDVATKIMTFGGSSPSSTLRALHEYKSCGKWYFPDAAGQYSGVPHDQQPFVAGWKYAFVHADVGS